MAKEVQLMSVSWKNDDSTMQIKHKWEKTKCNHPRVEFDEDSRTVLCAVCGNKIDAFDFLMSLAFEESHQINKLKSLQDQVNKLEKQKLKLKRELKL